MRAKNMGLSNQAAYRNTWGQTVLIGNSPAMQLVKRQIERIGQSSVPVLIQGESGTGKEVVARSIYEVAPKGPFVAIDCSALSSQLIESELFGHERGAFTGATTSRIGLLPMADGGTAFIDEIGELPLSAQVKLLRALQQQEVRPVGSNQTKKCSYRVIAATNRDLAEEVQRGNFRLDLYYRLNVITLKIPPLRKHLEDLPALIDHFIRQGGHRKRVAPEVLDAMKAHRWPGNVRELENCVARLVALSADDLLHVEDLWIGGETSVCGDKRSIGERDDSASNDRALRKIECSSELNNIRIALGDFERNAIKRALDVVDGSPVRAAKMLGISRTTLYRKLKSYEGKNISK